MKTTVQLIAMPWARPDMPSAQLGTLKAYLDQELDGSIVVQAHSGFLQILNGLDAMQVQRAFGLEEWSYSYLVFEKFGPKKSKDKLFLGKLRKEINSLTTCGRNLTASFYNQLYKNTVHFVDTKIVPHLQNDAVNIIGFTLNFHQVASSLLCALILKQRCFDKKILFVFGGSSVSHPKVIDYFNQYNLDAVGVLGEGEMKLKELVSRALALKSYESNHDLLIDDDEKNGIFDFSSEIDLSVVDSSRYKSQISNIEDLPLPNYTEYFELLEFSRTVIDLGKPIKIPIEGSRGCFARCDFCSLNTSWSGFRKKPAKHIYDRVTSALSRYNSDYVFFLDNVCDTWAQEYADLILASGVVSEAFMELRVHHKFSFWETLAKAGVKKVQIGLEAIAPSLLKAMKKGTTVHQNILVHKWLQELGVESMANLITHHPRSTLQDVEDTKMMLTKISHLKPFNLSYFSLGIGSPLYNELEPSVKNHLKSLELIPLPKWAHAWMAPNHAFENPKQYHNEEVLEAWDDFAEWYQVFLESRDRIQKMKVVEEGLDYCRVILVSKRQETVIELNGVDAVLLRFCHQGWTIDRLAAMLQVGLNVVQNHLNGLIERGLVVMIDGMPLSLATRELGNSISKSCSPDGREREDDFAGLF